jgi:hypothetical protein
MPKIAEDMEGLPSVESMSISGVLGSEHARYTTFLCVSVNLQAPEVPGISWALTSYWAKTRGAGEFMDCTQTFPGPLGVRGLDGDKYMPRVSEDWSTQLASNDTRDSRAFLTRWILSGVESRRRLGGPDLCRPVVRVTGALDGLGVSGEDLELDLRSGKSFFT